jgi:phage shock protein C
MRMLGWFRLPDSTAHYGKEHIFPFLAHRLRSGGRSGRHPPDRRKGGTIVQKQSYWSLFNRPDTLFGICEGVGQDLGFNPNYLRVALAVSMIWNPVAVLATYALLGVAVAASRWITPAPVAMSNGELELVSSQGDNDEEAAPVAKAA